LNHPPARRRPIPAAVRPLRDGWLISGHSLLGQPPLADRAGNLPVSGRPCAVAPG